MSGSQSTTPKQHQPSEVERLRGYSPDSFHADDGNGGCVLCRQWVPGTDGDDEVMLVEPWPCPTVRLAVTPSPDESASLEPLRERLAFALEARDVQLGGSPHITPGNRFYLDAADSIIALMPPPTSQPEASSVSDGASDDLSSSAEPSTARQRYLQALMDEYDAYGQNIGYARKIGGPITKPPLPASASPDALDVERLGRVLEEHQREDRKGFRHACLADCAEEIAVAYAEAEREASDA